MSLLPGQILPYTNPIGSVNADGTVTIDKDWYLLFWNICQQILGNSGANINTGLYAALMPSKGPDFQHQIAELRQLLAALPNPAGRIAKLECEVADLRTLTALALKGAA